jgi:hypothetical protein
MVRVSAFVVDGVPNSGTYFRYEFFSETDLRGLRSSASGASMRYVGSVLRSVLAGVAFVGPTATYILLAQ